jgi:hypothetical protein
VFLVPENLVFHDKRLIFPFLAYIEDSLPSIWNTHAASSIDRISLSNYIEQMSVQLCLDPTLVDFNINSQHVHKSRTTVSSECLERNAEQMMTLVDEYIQNHLSSVVSRIVVDDIPPLLLTTKFHVKSIVDHFDRYTQQHVLFEMNNASLGNPQDIINSIIQVANLNHSIDSIHSLRKFTSSATIH